MIFNYYFLYLENLIVQNLSVFIQYANFPKFIMKILHGQLVLEYCHLVTCVAYTITIIYVTICSYIVTLLKLNSK